MSAWPMVLHGAVRLHALESSPSPDTKVRCTCPDALLALSAAKKIDTHSEATIRLIIAFPLSLFRSLLDHLMPPAARDAYADLPKISSSPRHWQTADSRTAAPAQLMSLVLD